MYVHYHRSINRLRHQQPDFIDLTLIGLLGTNRAARDSHGYGWRDVECFSVPDNACITHIVHKWETKP